MATDRDLIMAKMGQLEDWLTGLIRYVDATTNDLASAREHLDMLATMMDQNTERMAHIVCPEHRAPLETYLERRKVMGG